MSSNGRRVYKYRGNQLIEFFNTGMEAAKLEGIPVSTMHRWCMRNEKGVHRTKDGFEYTFIEKAPVKAPRIPWWKKLFGLK